MKKFRPPARGKLEGATEIKDIFRVLPHKTVRLWVFRNIRDSANVCGLYTHQDFQALSFRKTGLTLPPSEVQAMVEKDLWINDGTIEGYTDDERIMMLVRLEVYDIGDWEVETDSADYAAELVAAGFRPIP